MQSVKVIDEIRQITGEAVAKKQDAAKLNYPSLIEDIKIAAKRGDSLVIIPTGRMNEYDKALLETDGFRVFLQDKPKHPYDPYDNLANYKPMNFPKKEWIIKW